MACECGRFRAGEKFVRGRDCATCWRRANPYRTDPNKPRPAPLVRQKFCLHLAERTEFRAGCGGWNCLHVCKSDVPAVFDHLGGVMEAVPGDDCQDCPGYVAR